MSTPLPALGASRDVYRYRKQRGVNLGSWFVKVPNEKNAVAPGQADLHIANGQNARRNLEEHWSNWIKDEDWRWIIDHGYNTIRLPIGYYHLCGVDPKVIQDTDFAPFQYVFEGAWKFIENALDTAARYNIGVLVDLHAAVGAQNPDAHSGTGSGSIRLWDIPNADRTVYALQVLLTRLVKYDNVVGLELMNEPHNRSWLPEWYTWTLGNLRAISPDIPLYVGDAWNSDQYCPWAGLRQDFTIVDQHLYRCFTDADRAKYGDQHAAELKANVAPQFRNLIKQCRGNLIVGEFSAALGGQPPGASAGETDRQCRGFAKAQLDIYEESCAGWFFWTLKKAEGWDAGWSLMNATLAEIMPAYVGKRKRPVPNDSQLDNAKNTAYTNHVNYWNGKITNTEHWRFVDGFSQGWNDGKLFFTFPGNTSLSEIGFKGEWVKRRVAEHVAATWGSDRIWEFEHGFDQGYSAIFGLM